MAKVSDVEFPSVLLAEQGSDPATPASGFARLYAKAVGLFFKGDDGVVLGPLGVKIARKTANESTSLMTFIDSAGMSFPVAANTNYKFRFIVWFNTNATSVGIRLAINGPAAPTALKVGGFIATGAGAANDSTIAQGSVAAYDTTIVATTTGPGGTSACAIIEGVLLNGANAGNLTLRHASETATATTIEANSHGELVAF